MSIFFAVSLVIIVFSVMIYLVDRGIGDKKLIMIFAGFYLLGNVLLGCSSYYKQVSLAGFSGNLVHFIFVAFLGTLVPFLIASATIIAFVRRRNRKMLLGHNAVHHVVACGSKDRIYSISKKVFLLSMLGLVILNGAYLISNSSDMAGIGFVFFLVLTPLVSFVIALIVYGIFILLKKE
jgi:hypothetical protein